MSKYRYLIQRLEEEPKREREAPGSALEKTELWKYLVEMMDQGIAKGQSIAFPMKEATKASGLTNIRSVIRVVRKYAIINKRPYEAKGKTVHGVLQVLIVNTGRIPKKK